MDTQETWKKSPLAPDHVEVSNFGRVRTLDRLAKSEREHQPFQLREGRVLSPYIALNGYYTVAIKVGPKRTKFLVHRLIGSAFCAGFDPTLTINHINGNKLDNRPKNLEWVSLATNTKLQWKTGLVDIRGEKHPSAKLSNADVRRVLASKERPAVLAKELRVSPALIYKIRSGKKRARPSGEIFILSASSALSQS